MAYKFEHIRDYVLICKKKMITQKLISFKINHQTLQRLDSTISDLPLNRNKFINDCVEFALAAIEIQVEVAKRQHKSLNSIPFLALS